MNCDLRAAMQTYTARVVTSGSVFRNNGKGFNRHARHFLSELNLATFATSDPPTFLQRLDQATQEMGEAWGNAERWGLARKVMNLFLRDVTFNVHLRDAFGLDACEPLLEVPLDSYVADGIRTYCTPNTLDEFPGVRYLTPDTSSLYQGVASAWAKKKKVPRIFLDPILWGNRSE